MGYLAGQLVQKHFTGVFATFSQLHLETEKWQPHALPFLPLITMETFGKSGETPVICRKVIDVNSDPAFLEYCQSRELNKVNDNYQLVWPHFWGTGENPDQKSPENCPLILQIRASY